VFRSPTGYRVRQAERTAGRQPRGRGLQPCGNKLESVCAVVVLAGEAFMRISLGDVSLSFDLDEPTEGLMPRMVSQIRQIIDSLHRDGVAILLVEQNVPLTLEASERVYIMEKGSVRHTCAACELGVNHPVIRQYLGV
jgi:hypothetical protein